MGLLLLLIDFGMAHIFVDGTKGSNISQGNIVPKGSDIHLKCNAFEAKTQKLLHMYLCKNGIVISMEITHGEEARFTLRSVKREDSGNYSCVYSIKKSYVHNVTSTNENSIIIQVTGGDIQSKIIQHAIESHDFAPAEIFTSAVQVLEGSTLDLRCAIFHKNEKHSGELHMYLCKNGVGIRMEILTAEKEKTFKLQDVKKEDTGKYSCVYSVHRYAAHTVTAVGQNYIFIQVKESMWWWMNVFRLLCSAGLVIAAIAVLVIHHSWNR